MHIFFTDVCEASKHAASTVHCLNNVMYAEYNITQNGTIRRQVTSSKLFYTDWFLRWAEIMTIELNTLAKEHFAEMCVLVIKCFISNILRLLMFVECCD